MTRSASLALFAAALATSAGRPAHAQLPVAPQPREVRPDGTHDPAPRPESPGKAEDPAAVVDRIIKNSKDVGDMLAKTDTGADTRRTQGKILSDIDALINRQEDPPPPKPDKNKKNNDKDKNDDKNMDKGNDQKMNDGMPPPKGDTSKDKSGTGGKQDGMPMGNMNDSQPMGGNGRRPRMGDPKPGDKKEPGKADSKPDSKDEKKGGQSKDPNDAKNPSGTAGGNPGGKAPPGKPSLPFDEDVAKDIWGHLPDKLRQQMTQFYKEDVMPKYSDLLRLYYSSLSEKSSNSTLPKK